MRVASLTESKGIAHAHFLFCVTARFAGTVNFRCGAKKKRPCCVALAVCLSNRVLAGRVLVGPVVVGPVLSSPVLAGRVHWRCACAGPACRPSADRPAGCTDPRAAHAWADRVG